MFPYGDSVNVAVAIRSCTGGRRHRKVCTQNRLADPNLLRHVSPLGWNHIVLTGDYDWNSGPAQRTNVRPLNLYTTKIRA